MRVGHHGYPRATKDVDVVPAPDPENLEKLWQALVEVEAQPLALGYFRLEEVPVPFSRDGLLQGGSWDLSTVHGLSTSSSTAPERSRHRRITSGFA